MGAPSSASKALAGYSPWRPFMRCAPCHEVRAIHGSGRVVRSPSPSCRRSLRRRRRDGHRGPRRDSALDSSRRARPSLARDLQRDGHGYRAVTTPPDTVRHTRPAHRDSPFFFVRGFAGATVCSVVLRSAGEYSSRTSRSAESPRWSGGTVKGRDPACCLRVARLSPACNSVLHKGRYP